MGAGNGERMTDYDDYAEWTDERTEKNYIGSEREYTKEELVEIIDECILDAQKAGLQDVKVEISASIDYDGCPYVSIRGVGKRKLTTDELAILEEQAEIEKKAKQLCITFYEASIVMRLEKSGKIMVKE
jgi:hypothetical protein